MNNPDLSTEGKQRAGAKAHQSALEQMQSLKDNFEGGAALAANTLGKTLFGAQQLVGQDALSMRDAHDRASRIEDPGEARELIARADLTGDEHLVGSHLAGGLHALLAGLDHDEARRRLQPQPLHGITAEPADADDDDGGALLRQLRSHPLHCVVRRRPGVRQRRDGARVEAAEGDQFGSPDGQV